VVGHPSTAILKYAKETNGDLVIVGSHGHTALGSLIMGSCSSALVRKALFPVLVVPALEPDADRE
jgi:nucleotide-binding universal stress UspA family protein